MHAGAPIHHEPTPDADSLRVALRPGRPGDRDFVQSLSGASFARLGAYDGILTGWFDHASVNTTLATVEGSSVGFVMWAFVDREPDGPTPRVADVIAIAVEDAWRGKGIGRALLRCALRQASALAPSVGARRIELSVAEDNPLAGGLFASEGFVRRPKDDVRYPGGQRCLRLARSFLPPAVV